MYTGLIDYNTATKRITDKQNSTYRESHEWVTYKYNRCALFPPLIK